METRHKNGTDKGLAVTLSLANVNVGCIQGFKMTHFI